MNLYRLGLMPWAETQAIYHVLARTRQEGLVICRPSAPCVCLGLHDDLEQEVNVKYCQDHNIPLIRRDIGGGMVLLAKEQIFFQLVLRAGNPLLAGRREEFFAKFLEPAIKTLASFHIRADLKPPADIVVNGKKISGNGAGDINGFAVYTGNILVAFDRTTMSNVLNLPSPRFRELTRLSMQRYLTTMEEELGYTPDFTAIEEQLIANFSTWTEGLQSVPYSEKLKTAVKATAKDLTSSDFLNLPGKQTQVRQVKINEGTYIRLHHLPECFTPNVSGNRECINQEGKVCPGYAILIIQGGEIIEFESNGFLCWANSHINSLKDYLLGTKWCDSDIRSAICKWQQSLASNITTINEELLLRWLLVR